MKGAIIVGLSELSTLRIFEFETPMKEKLTALKVITGNRFDNQQHVLIESSRGHYAFGLYRNQGLYGSEKYKSLQEKFGKSVEPGKVYEVTIWDAVGWITLLTIEFKIEDHNKPIPGETVAKIKDTIGLYEQGKVHCSDCDRVIDRVDIAGRYFAGMFCAECWNGTAGQHKGKGGWREIEKNETYD